MKGILIFCVAVLAFLAIAMTYSTATGYTQWFFRDFSAQVLVDSHPVQGYVHIHKSKKFLFVTRRDTKRPHSYAIERTKAGAYRVDDCGDWAATPFLVFAVGHVNPPCFFVSGESANEQPDAPASSVSVNGPALEFRTTDGKLVSVVR
jgi:hypothetical protein